MYAQSYVVHWTQEYNKKELRPTRRSSHALQLWWTLQNNSNSNELKQIYRVLHEKNKNSDLKVKNPKNLKI